MVPNLGVADLARTRAVYTELLGLEVAMDMGWIVTLASPSSPTAQVSLLEGGDPGGPCELTVEVEDVDAVYAAAVARGVEIVYPLADEQWGVRRFFFRDPDGRVVNVMSHPPGG